MPSKILLLEDDVVLRRQLCRFFRRFGYEVHDAGTVADFLERAATERFDTCLFDLSLPDGDGLDAWGAFRGMQDGAAGILMTAYGGTGVEERAARASVRAVLAKPLDLLVLRGVVDAAACRPAQGSERP